MELSRESLRALMWDEHVESVAEYPPMLDAAPAARFVGTATHGEREYRVWLADGGSRYDQVRVARIATELEGQYKASIVGAFAPSVGRPWVLLRARAVMARALARDHRVAWVAEQGTPAAAVAARPSLVPLPRGRRPPEPAAKEAAQPPRGTLRHASRHYRDWYFVALDPERTDTSTDTAIGRLADVLCAGSGGQRLGGEFLKPPQGFRFSGTEAAALRIAQDPRVKWVDEVGPYLRTVDPRPGEYFAAFAQQFPRGGSGGSQLAEELAETYGGRLTSLVSFGFALADMTPEAARALIEDPRVGFVEENGNLQLDLGAPPKVDVPEGCVGRGCVPHQQFGEPRETGSQESQPAPQGQLLRVARHFRDNYLGAPRFVVKCPEEVARALAMDDRVSRVAEDSLLPIDARDPAEIAPLELVPHGDSQAAIQENRQAATTLVPV